MLNLIVNIKFSMQKGYVNILGAVLILWIIRTINEILCSAEWIYSVNVNETKFSLICKMNLVHS